MQCPKCKLGIAHFVVNDWYYCNDCGNDFRNNLRDFAEDSELENGNYLCKVCQIEVNKHCEKSKR